MRITVGARFFDPMMRKTSAFMKKSKDQKKERQPEVETPRPPQVMDPSRPPGTEDQGFEKNPPKHGSNPAKKSEKKDKKGKTQG